MQIALTKYIICGNQKRGEENLLQTNLFSSSSRRNFQFFLIVIFGQKFKILKRKAQTQPIGSPLNKKANNFKKE